MEKLVTLTDLKRFKNDYDAWIKTIESYQIFNFVSDVDYATIYDQKPTVIHLVENGDEIYVPKVDFINNVLYYRCVMVDSESEEAFLFTIKVYFDDEEGQYVGDQETTPLGGSGSDVEAIVLNKDATPLAGLKIGDTSYRLLPLGTVVNAGHIAIGENSAAYGQYSTGSSVAIGSSSKANANATIAIGARSNCNQDTGIAIGFAAYVGGTDGVAIGRNASASSYYTTAIGLGAKAGTYGSSAFGHNALNRINGSVAGTTCPTVTFDGKSSSDLPIFHIYDSTKIFFRNDYSLDATKTCAEYLSGHYLSEYIKNNTLTEASGLYYPSYTDANNYQTFTKNVVSGTATAIDKKITGVHITLKLSNNNVAGLDLLMYDTANSQAFTAYAVCDSNASLVSAYIDSDGLINITTPAGVTVSSATYYLR